MTLFFKSSLQRWFKNIKSEWSLSLVLFVSFFMILMTILVFQNLERKINKWGYNLKMSLILEDTSEEGSIQKIKEKIRSNKLVKSQQLISPEKAKKLFHEQFPDLIESTESDFSFPSTFEVVFFNKEGAVEEIKKISKVASQWDGVREVLFGENTILKYITFISNIKYVSWLFVSIMGGISLILISFAIKNSIMRRRKEIEVFELIGATSNEIKIPYLMEGCFVGGLSVSVALLALYLITLIKVEYFSINIGYIKVSSQLEFFSGIQIIFILFFSILLCGGAAYLSASNQTRGWKKKESYYA